MHIKSKNKKEKIEKETVEKSYTHFLKNNSITDRDILDDGNLDCFDNKIVSWLSNVETDEEEQLFLYLLKNYNYYNRISIANSFKNGYGKFIGCEPDYKETVYMGVASRGGVYNGSSELVPVFKRINKIDKLRIADKPKDFYEKYDLKDVKNIVLVDDIIGSGTTVKRYIDENLIKDFPELIHGMKIYVICVIALEKGLSVLNDYALQNNLFIKVIYEHDIVKTFDMKNGLFTEDKKRISAMGVVRKYDTKLARRKEEILGFKKSQALVSFYHNTPNNTFPIFWQEAVVENNVIKVPWSPLFERDEGREGLPERDKPTHENLNTIKNEKKFKDRLLGKILSIINK